MFKYLNLITIFFLVLFQSTSIFAQYQDNNLVNIAIINSYEFSNEWGQLFYKNLKKDIQIINKDIQVNNIYLNASNKYNSSNIIINNIADQLQNSNIIITIGEEAIRSLIATGVIKDIIRCNIPLLVCDIKNINGLDSLQKDANIFLLPIKDNVKDNIDLITSKSPNIKNIQYISQQYHQDSSNISTAKNYIKNNYPHIRFNIIYNHNITHSFINNLKNKLIQQQSVILLNNYNGDDILTEDAKEMNIPIYSLKYIDNIQNPDYIGGIYENINEYTNNVAQIITQLLDNKNIITNNIGVKLDTDKQLVNKEYSYNIIYFITIFILLMCAIIFIILKHRFSKLLKKREREINLYSKTIDNNLLIYKSTTLGIASFDIDGKILDYNVEFIKSLKYISDQNRISPTTNLFNFKSTPANLIDIFNTNEQFDTIFNEENDKNILSYLKVSFRLVNCNDKKTIIVSIADITNNINDLKKKFDLYLDYNKAINESQIGVALININNNKYYVNKAYKKLLSISDNNFYSLFNNLPKEIFEEIEGKLNSNLDNFNIKNIVFKDISGNTKNIDLYIKKLDNSDFTHSFITNDITNIINSKEKINEFIKSVEEKIIIKNGIIQEMDTQIKTPLNAIIGFAELLLETTDINEQKELLEHLATNNNSFLNLIKTIIDITNIKSGSVKINKTDFNAYDKINETIKVLKEENQLDIQLLNKENIILYSDDNLFCKMLSILLQFTANISSNVSVKYMMVNNQMQLIIGNIEYSNFNDNYISILNNDKESLPYYSIESNIDNELNLELLKYIIKLLNGNISFVCNDNNYYNILVTLNIQTQHKEEKNIANQLKTATDKVVNRQQIVLIAEDNDNNFKLLRYILKNKYNILYAKNGEEAIKIYEDLSPDIILMDIKMPIMDGYTAAKLIREKSSEIPIIAVTAFNYEQEAMQDMKQIFNAIISKPVNEQELMNNIVNLTHTK